MQKTQIPLAKVLPATAQITGDGHLSVGGCDLVDLAREWGTPLYVFDEETLRGQCRAFLQAFRSRYPNTAVAYAAKAYLGRAMAGHRRAGGARPGRGVRRRAGDRARR